MPAILPDRTCIVFDLEVTDLSLAETARTLPQIIDIGAIKVDSSGEVIGEWSALVRPPRLEWITAYTTSLTGITVEMCEAAAPWAEVWREFAEFCEWRRGRLCHWGASDPAWLRHAYESNRIGYPHLGQTVCLCSVCWAMAAVIGCRPKKWSLKHAARRFDVELPKVRHRALPDAYAAWHVAQGAFNLHSELFDGNDT